MFLIAAKCLVSNVLVIFVYFIRLFTNSIMSCTCEKCKNWILHCDFKKKRAQKILQVPSQCEKYFGVSISTVNLIIILKS